MDTRSPLKFCYRRRFSGSLLYRMLPHKCLVLLLGLVFAVSCCPLSGSERISASGLAIMFPSALSHLFSKLLFNFEDSILMSLPCRTFLQYHPSSGNVFILWVAMTNIVHITGVLRTHNRYVFTVSLPLAHGIH